MADKNNNDAMAAFRARMNVLESIPPSNEADAAIKLAYQGHPQLDKIIRQFPGLPNQDYGEWTSTAINLFGTNPQVKAHELSHELEYQTGIGTNFLGRGTGRYAKYGQVPVPILEGAADVISGTRGYLPDLTPEQRSQAHSIALMTMAAAREPNRPVIKPTGIFGLGQK